MRYEARKCYPMWWSFHSERWLSQKEYSDTDIEDLKDRISKRFERFTNKDLLAFIEALEGLREFKLDKSGI